MHKLSGHKVSLNSHKFNLIKAAWIMQSSHEWVSEISSYQGELFSGSSAECHENQVEKTSGIEEATVTLLTSWSASNKGTSQLSSTTMTKKKTSSC